MSDENLKDFLILANKRYLSQTRWAKEKRVTTRTAARHREQGLPWLAWGGEIYIPEVEGDEYIAARVKRRNPRKRT